MEKIKKSTSLFKAECRPIIQRISNICYGENTRKMPNSATPVVNAEKSTTCPTAAVSGLNNKNLTKSGNNTETKWSNFKQNRVAPIAKRVHERHLEMEPLCCIGSCLIREGCWVVAVCELLFVLLTSFILSVRFWQQHFISGIQQAFLATLLLFNMLTLVMLSLLIAGLLRFNKLFVRAHWYYQFGAIAYSLAGLIFYAVMVGKNMHKLDVFTVFMAVSLLMLLLMEVWGVAVIQQCYKYFVLCHVFVTLAE